MTHFKPIAHATPEGRVAVYIGAGYQQLPLDAARSLHTQLVLAIAEVGNRRENETDLHVQVRLDHAVHAYKVASVARMAMETDSDAEPTLAVLDASIREGVRAALATVDEVQP